MNKIPYWRLSGFYFFYFASLGTLIPYWSLYLKSSGFNPVEIGELIAIIMATKIISPNIWGWIADHTGKNIQVVRITAILAALSFAGVFWGSEFYWLALVMSLFSFFWNASLPQFEAVTLNHLGCQQASYSRIRLWGSVGFVIAVATMGPVLDHYGTEILPLILLLQFSIIGIASYLVPEKTNQHHPETAVSILNIIKQKEVIAFMMVIFLMQAAHGPYYTFYSLYLEQHHYTKSVIGQLWAVGVIAEVLLLIFMHHLLIRYSLKQILLASFALAFMRWLLIAGFADSFTMLMFAQVLHAATFGAFHIAAIHLTQRYFKGKHLSRGQALYSSISFGAGGAAGSLYGGYVWDKMSPETIFYIASVITLAAFIIAWKWINNNNMEGTS